MPSEGLLRRGLLVALVTLSGVLCGWGQGTRSVVLADGPVVGGLSQDGKVVAFKGIPYAAPPIGPLRWQPPAPVPPWTAPRDATAFGHRCLQADAFGDMVFHDAGAAEDCLNLNVWTPASAPRGKLPVMVWVYGGGFLTGGTSENRQDGQMLAEHGVVVVSMNYRLGLFGFLSLAGLTAESSHHASGNYGLMDQAAALRWVRRNIAALGGDPQNVTIFGESAGSFAVSTLMASPLSKGLFEHAIGESGGAFRSNGLGYQPRQEREARDGAFMRGRFGTEDVTALRRLSADDLLRAVVAAVALPGAVGGRPDGTPPAPRFGPDVDGYFLPRSVEAIYAAGQQAHVPLLAGWNSDEGRGQVLSARQPWTAASFQLQAKTEYGDRAAAFLTLYPASNDAEALQSAADYAGDQFIALSTWRWLEAALQTGGSPVYRYLFRLGSPGDANHAAAQGAFHSDEIEYVFGVLDSRPKAVWRPEDRRLSAEMMAYWTNFARTGDPNGPGLPRWPSYGAPDFPTMQLDAQSHALSDPYRPRYLFLSGEAGTGK